MRVLCFVATALMWLAPISAQAQLRINESTLNATDQERLGAILSFLTEFYEARGETPAWTEPKNVEIALDIIAGVSADGLDPEDFAYSKLRALAGEGHSTDLDIQLTANIALIGYVLNNGKTDPTDLDLDGFWDRISGSDPALDLNIALDTGLLREAVDRLRPASEHYQQLRDALREHRAIAAAGGWPSVSEGSTLRLNDEGPRVKELTDRLVASGYLTTSTDVFDEVVEAGVIAFQSAHGEDSDGLAGNRTIAAMNVSVQQRIDQLRVNLERARWIGDLPAGRHIIVNIAGYYAAVIENRQPIWTTRVIVGKEYTSTPVFLDEVEYLEFNPTWTAPRSITRNELAPRIIRDRSYLARNGYYLANANGSRVNPNSVNWSSINARNFPYWVVQQPGERNALGRVKFMFPNEHSVYMHDTPNRGLFDRTQRTFSHGCIRTESPLDLAALLLAGQGWDAARIDETIASGNRTRVPLDQTVPVAILYWTADPTPSGVKFYPDIYGRDSDVLAALNRPLQLEDR